MKKLLQKTFRQKLIFILRRISIPKFKFVLCDFYSIKALYLEIRDHYIFITNSIV